MTKALLLAFVLAFAIFVTTALGQGLTPVPDIVVEPAHTQGDSNVVFFTTAFQNCSEVPFLQYATDPSFAPEFIVESIQWPRPGESHAVRGLGDGVTYWYRIVTVDCTTDVASSTQDQTAPQVTRCEVLAGASLAGDTTNNTNLTLDFEVEDPAGIREIQVYYRLPLDDNVWYLLDAFSYANDPFNPQVVRSESIPLHDTIAFYGDNHYEFAISARDDAKDPKWVENTNDPAVGNLLEADTALCSVKIDTKVPVAEITNQFDTLYTSFSVPVQWTANDTVETANGSFKSGLKCVYLYYQVRPENGSYGTALVDTIECFVDPDVGLASGVYEFGDLQDSSWYRLAVTAEDNSGQEQILPAFADSFHVFRGIRVWIDMWDPNDIDDHLYSGSHTVRVEINSNVTLLESVVLEEPGRPNSDITLLNLEQLPDTVDYTFIVAGDGLRHLMCTGALAGKATDSTDSIIVDTGPPQGLQLHTPKTFTVDRSIPITITATDPPFHRLQDVFLSESPNFSEYDSIRIDTSGVTVNFLLSPDSERKYIYGYVTDPAENRSEETVIEIQLGAASHNYPNPFNPDEERTTIVFTRENAPSSVTLMIYDLFGNLVLERTGIVPEAEGEVFTIPWDGLNGKSETVASGGYICVIEADGNHVSTHKIAVIR